MMENGKKVSPFGACSDLSEGQREEDALIPLILIPWPVAHRPLFKSFMYGL